MIMVTAKITAKSGEKENIIAKAQDLIISSRLDPGCISYNLYTSTEDENVLLMLEQWENFELLQSHMQTEHFKVFGTATEDILADEMDISVYSAAIKN
ncbi:putative quinol monooxygenase [Methanobacterium sp.]|jgi:quinol monooxygenase YgiN|uniref:putative quinol monooxygenase n=1 Tax=Methanobacterium sp. TaxID=2164 RepID=UPI003158122C